MKRILALLLLLLTATSALAQGTFTTLTGRITSGGRPVSGAKVTLASDSMQHARRTKSNTDGWYWFAGLPPATYKLTFAHEGMQTLIRNVEVHLAEPARRDAEMQAGDPGDMVTSTALTRSVLESPQLQTVIESEVVDNLPIDRTISSRAALAAPGLVPSQLLRDGIIGSGFAMPGDAILETTVLNSLASPEYGRYYDGSVILAVSRSGSNHTTASLRETWSNDPYRERPWRTEETVGGRILHDNLWFFLAGDSDDSSVLAKLTGSLGSKQQLVGTVIHDDERSFLSANDEGVFLSARNAVAVDYTNQLSSSFLLEGRTVSGRDDYSTLRGYGFVQNHDLSAGVERLDGRAGVFVDDRWLVAPRLVVEGGLRHDEDLGTSPRLGAVYDITGNGINRLSASYAHVGTILTGGALVDRDETTLAYARQLEANGYARVALIHREFAPDALQVDGLYRFVILTFGGSATWLRHYNEFASAWVQVEPPLPDQTLNISVLERYQFSSAATDLAINYSRPVKRVEPFVKAEVVDLFDRVQRSYRLGVGLRLP